MKRLAIITTHPIQYNAPWFRLLAERKNCELNVFYTWSQTKDAVKDRTFGKEITWDIPLLEGYTYKFVENVSKKPGSHHFLGIDCPTLISEIKKYQPDAILFFGWNFKSHLLAMYHFKGKVPVWFRGDSTLLDELPNFKTKLRRIVLKMVYSCVNKAFYVGEASKAYFLKHNLNNNQLVYAPHAIDNDRFMDNEVKQYEVKAKQWRQELGINDDDIVVVFAGKFESKKQPDLLIRTIIKANKNRTIPLKLLMVGNGPLEHHLNELAKDDENIQFLPFQNQTKMPLIYRLGDVLCLPSRGPGETWGLAVNEAMASGKPAIVSSKVGCTKDLIKDHDNGYIFSFDAISELRALLESLTISELKRLGLQAEKDIQGYNFETIVKAIETEMIKLETSKTTIRK
jgi:glycosyltransferase involved in cell wall biosynthesis